jgi:cell wall-associated NlpC family hydrolase
MPQRAPTTHRLAVAAVAAVIAACAAGPAMAAPAAARVMTVQAAQARVLADQDTILALSATLASVRNELSTDLTPDQSNALAVEQSKLQVRKTRAIARLAVDQRALTRAIAAQAQADAAANAALSASTLTSTTPPLLNAIANSGLPAPATMAAAIDSFLSARNSPLTGLGAVFVADGEAAGVDPRFLVAISGGETSFGTYGPAQAIHNPFGMGPNIHFASWSAAIQAAATNLGGPLYRGAGLMTIPQIQARWAPLGAGNDPNGLNGNWQTAIGQFYSQLGGDPSGSVMIGASNTLVSLTPVAPQVGTAGPAAADTALGLLGVPSPADSPDGLNDVQLVQTVYQDQGVALPGTLSGLAAAGDAVQPLGLRRGDAVFFAGAGGAIVHVGLYLGGGQFIHAPGPGRRVSIASLYAAPWRHAYKAARRY